MPRVERPGLRLDRERDPGWRDRDAIDIATPHIRQRVTQPPPLRPQRCQHPSNLILRTRADTAAASEAQPMTSVDQQPDHDQHEHTRYGELRRRQRLGRRTRPPPGLPRHPRLLGARAGTAGGEENSIGTWAETRIHLGRSVARTGATTMNDARPETCPPPPPRRSDLGEFLPPCYPNGSRTALGGAQPRSADRAARPARRAPTTLASAGFAKPRAPTSSLPRSSCGGRPATAEQAPQVMADRRAEAVRCALGGRITG